MKKRCLVAFLFFLLCFIIPIVFAQEEIPVSVYVINIDHYDLSSGEYYMDFFIQFDCQTSCDLDDFSIVNGRIIDIEKSFNIHNETFYRIYAALYSEVELVDFPFDTQEIGIVLEDRKRSIEFVKLTPRLDNSGVDSHIAFPGWKIKSWKAFTTDHYYGVFDETYSSYVFVINISRIVLDAFVQNFLPVFFILFIILFTFALGIKKLELRLGIVSSGLIAAVMFHIAITSHMPSVGYLTFADKFMIVAYFILLAVFLVNIFILRYLHLKKIKLAKKIQKYAGLGMVLLTLLLYFILFVFFL